jgi:hypothetical protein
VIGDGCWKAAGGGLLDCEPARLKAAIAAAERFRRDFDADVIDPNLAVLPAWVTRRVEQDFPSFRVIRTYRRFMHAPPLTVHWLPGGALLGWHLWIDLAPRG